MHLRLAVLQIKDLGAKAGIVLNPGTNLQSIEEVGVMSLLQAHLMMIAQTAQC